MRRVDVLADVGHREGARLLSTPWADFLDTDPPRHFLDERLMKLRELFWNQAQSFPSFDVAGLAARGRRCCRW